MNEPHRLVRTIHSGDSVVLRYTLFDSGTDEQVDPATYTQISFGLTKFPFTHDADAVFTKTLGNGVAITDDDKIDVSIFSYETEELVGDYVMQIRLENGTLVKHSGAPSHILKIVRSGL